MKKSLFSRGVFVESLRRLRVFGFIALAVMLILQLAPAIIELFNYFYYVNSIRPDEIIGGNDVTPDAVNAGLLLLAVPFTAAIVTPIMVLLAFSVFNKRSSSDFYHSLPYTRPCIFVSTMAAVFTWVVGICLVCTAAGLISYMAFPKVFTVIFDGTGELLLTYLAFMLLTAGGTAIAMAATGNLLSNICVTGLILFLPRFIMTIMTFWIADSASFLVFNEMGTSFLSYSTNVLFGTVAKIFMLGEPGDFSANYLADIYSICLGIIYLGLALLVFIKRKSETATQPAPGRGVQHVIRIMLTMVVGIFSTILFVEGEWAGFIIISLLTAIVYFAYELITTHRWKNLLRALPFYGVVVGLCILCGVVIIAVPRVEAEYTPSPSEIDSVRLINDNYVLNDEWFGIEAQELELEDETIIKTVSEALKSNMDVFKEHGYITDNLLYGFTEDKMYGYYPDENYTVSQVVAIKSGPFVKYRSIAFTREEYSTILQALDENEEYIKSCKTLPKPAKGSLDFDIYDKDVDYSFYEDVFECLQQEINSISFEKWYTVANNLNVGLSEYRLWYNSDDYNTKYVTFNIPSSIFPKTFDMLVETDKIGYEERYLVLDKMVNDEEFASETEFWYIELSATVLTYDDNGERVYYNATATENPSWDWDEHPYREAFKDMLEKADKCEDPPSSRGYILVTYNYESENDSDYGDIYLPIPKDFDPLEWKFTPVYENEVYYGK